MKLDEILDKLALLSATAKEEVSDLAELVYQLAQHVKAQEPEPIESYDEECQRLKDAGYTRASSDDEVPNEGDYFDSRAVLWRQPPAVRPLVIPLVMDGSDGTEV